MPFQRSACTAILAVLAAILMTPSPVRAQAPTDAAMARLTELAAIFQAEGRNPTAAARLAGVAAERAALLQALMESDPAAVLRHALPADLRAALPPDVQANVEEHVTVEGDVAVFYEDYEHDSRLIHVLQTARGRLSLRIAGAVPELQSDQRIRVRGVRLAGDLAADGGSIVPVTSALSYSRGEQRVLMILITFQDATNPPYSVATAQQLLFGTVNDFMRENSQEQTWLTGDVAGWFPTTLSRTTCDSTAISNAARQAATAAGYDLTRYRRFIYGFTSNSCSWWGLGQVGGSTSYAWVNGNIATRVVAHELGHNLGVYHALALECGAATLGSNCSTIEYGNPADVMGVSGTVAHFNAFKKERMGWLNYGSSSPLLTVDGDGTYSIEPYAAAGGGIKGLKILKETNPTTGRRTFYYVEYRGGGYGFDNGLRTNTAMQNGVMISIGTESSANSSYALDMTPETTSWSDAPLPVGRTFSDATARVNITPVAVSSSGATIAVTFGGATCTTSSPSISITPAQQSGTAGATLRWTMSVRNNDTSLCSASAFDVMASVPAGWSAATPAASLSISPGQTGTATVDVTSSHAATSGTYGLQLSTARNAASVSASASYVVMAPLALAVDTNATSYSKNQTVTMWAVATSGGAPVAGVWVTFTVRAADGRVSTLSATTDGSGRASASMRITGKPTVGTWTVTAATAGATSVMTTFLVR